MADASLATPDAVWSDPADYRPRFEIQHVEPTLRGAGSCRVLVTEGKLSMACGQPLGADGRCSSGRH